MNLEFLDSKDGDKTVKANGIFLHSPYSPKKEADRFVDFLTCPFNPAYIVITEPGLSYCVKEIRSKFPQAKVGAIRYVKDFDSFNKDFDFVFYKEKGTSIKNQLNSYFSEEKIFSVFFISWKPSEKAFPDENAEIWNEIKEALDFSKTLLITRQFFEKKWLINTTNFIKYSNDFYSINKTNLPLLITASGPSLEENLSTIKKLSKACLIIALSSSLSVLLKNDIIPDFCMTSDGGYWAKEHLKKLHKYNIPLAITSEADCQKKILKTHALIPMCYEDGISHNFCKMTELPFIKAKRNGTISGTALETALEITDNKIYFFGLDLKEARGFQHTQPNELEINASISDTRLNSKEKRAARQGLKNQALMIYENWFKEKKLPQNKVFRVISEKLRKNSLGDICDISPEDFNQIADKILAENNIKKPDCLLKKISASSENKNLNKILSYIKEESESQEWKKSLFPLDYTALLHNPQNEEIKKKLEKENSRLCEKLQKILIDE